MEQRPFTAASNKYAYAQAFTAPTVRRQSTHRGFRLLGSVAHLRPSARHTKTTV
jgi:hypothetical protein